MDKDLDFVKGILCDLDGTLYFKGKAIPGAVKTIQILTEAGYKLLFLILLSNLTYWQTAPPAPAQAYI